MKRIVGKEQYFTHPALAQRCVDYARSLLDFDRFECFIEPSAGEGAFLNLLPQDRRLGIDIEPRAASIVRADFLAWQPPRGMGTTLTIGNPPFGQRGSLAISFLQKACSFSQAVAFILPRSFNKYTFQNRVPRYFHLLGSFDCEEFLGARGEACSVKTVFQVWEKRRELRSQVQLPTTHTHFSMRHAHLSRVSPKELERLRNLYEFAVPQVGSDFTPRPSHSVDKGSYWFIRPNTSGVQERFRRLDFRFLDGMNTAHKSLSKRDIILAYQAVLDEESAIGEAASVGTLPDAVQLDLWGNPGV